MFTVLLPFLTLAGDGGEPFDYLAGRGVVWQAGRLDGFPQRPGDVVEEADGPGEEATAPAAGAAHGTTAEAAAPAAEAAVPAVVEVHEPGDFPLVIGPRQTVVVDLDEVAPQDLVFEAVIGQDQDMERPFPWYRDNEGQFVQVLFNNRPIYHRWEAEGATHLRAFIAREWFREDTNRLVIDNQSSVARSVDAVWLAPPQVPETPTWVALRNADWVGPETARDLPCVAVRLPVPRSHRTIADLQAFLGDAQPVSWRPIEQRQRAWSVRNLKAEAAKLGLDEQELAIFAIWGEHLHRLMARGAEPVVMLRLHGDPTWLRLAWLYRDAVQRWQFEVSDPAAVRPAIDLLRRLQPDAQIVIEYRGEHPGAERLPVPVSVRATETFRLDEKVVRERQASMAQRAPWEALHNQGLDCYWLTGLHGYDSQKWVSVNVAECVLNHLHAGGGSAVLYGGKAGSGLFPDRSSEPTPTWQVVRLLAALGHGDARRIPCNVLSYDAGRGLLDSAWVAVRNGESLVTIAVFAAGDRGRQVTLQCPVPWSGKAELYIRRVSMNLKQVPAAAKPERQKVTLAARDEGGLLDAPVTLANLTLVQVLRPGADPPTVTVLNRTAAEHDVEPLVEKLLTRSYERLPKEGWAVSLTEQPHAVPLGPNVKVRRAPATPSKSRHHVEGFLPWHDESTFVTFENPKKHPDQPRGIDLWPDWNRFPQAETIRFWVRPTSTRGQSSVVLRVASRAARGRILLRTNEWTAVDATFADLFGQGRPGGYLTFRLDPQDHGLFEDHTITFEFNAFHGLGPVPAGVRKAPEPRLLKLPKEGEDRQLFLLVAPAGTAVQTLARLDLDTRFETIQAFDVTGARASIHRSAGFLHLAVPRMPERTPEAVAGFVADLPKAQRHWTNVPGLTAVMFAAIDPPDPPSEPARKR